jgi:3-methyl-2-oxobutanoate hydroxymethyltransferase
VTLQEMKRAQRKIVGVVAWDYQIAQIADRAGVDLVSVGDSVGVNLWGQAPDAITLEEMLIVCKAVRRGVKRAVVSFDLPSSDQSVDAALRRLRMAHAAIGYGFSNLDAKIETYANVARVSLEALSAYADDVRAGRQIKGQRA